MKYFVKTLWLIGCFGMLTPLIIRHGDSIECDESKEFLPIDEPVPYELSLDALAQPTGTQGLQQDVDDIIALIPVDEVKNLTIEYYVADKEVQLAYDYIRSTEFASIRRKMMDLEEVKEFLQYLDNAGLNIIVLMERLGAVIEPSDMPTVSASIKPINDTIIGGLLNMVEDILQLLPQDQILSTFMYKLDTSPEFLSLIERIGSEEFERIVDFVKNSREFRNLVSKLRSHGIDIRKIMDLIQRFCGFGSF